MPDPEMRIKQLTSLEEVRQCIEIQRATWGWKD